MKHESSSRMRKAAITGAAVLGTLIGAAGIAGAVYVQNDTPTTTPSTVVDDSTGTDTGTDIDNDNDTGTENDTHETTEELLTGTVADQASAAALAAVPGGTIDRVETDDDDGAAFEAHMTDADGNSVTVKLDAAFALIEVDQGGEGHGGRGDHDGDHEDGDHDDDGATGDSSEELLTGTIADDVTAAALVAVPGATIDRVETDDHGAAYEAHMTDADGNEVTVTFDATMTVLEIEQGR